MIYFQDGFEPQDGDIITVKEECSGCVVGKEYIYHSGEACEMIITDDGEVVRGGGNCSCEYNHVFLRRKDFVDNEDVKFLLNC